MRCRDLVVLFGLLLCMVMTTAAVRAGETPLTTIRVASELRSPLYVTYAPDDFARVFIVEKGGRIRILRGGEVLGTPFLDISEAVRSGGERGLLGLAFHPNYAENGFLYVDYTNRSGNGNTVIARYQVSADPDVADPDSAHVLLKITQPDPNHNGGWLAFGPDGFLYIATGDGGPWFDPDNRAQDTTGELLGKVLRIDVNRDDWPGDPDRNYGIPPGNPFVGVEGDDEIWVFGLRNPWRCAFDTATGDLYITDVGQDAWEEINFQSAGSAGGENYGWRCREGLDCTSFGGCDCSSFTSTPPIHAYGNGGSECSIIGGEIYRGCAISDLHGTYFFADFCSDHIWSFRYDGANVTNLQERSTELAPGGGLDINTISSFGRDAFGELYICDLGGGEVFKIIPAKQPPPLSIIRSEPPVDAIDARQPSEPDGSRPAGWNSIELTFDACLASPITADDFLVTQQGGVGPAPTVVAVELLSRDTVSVILSHAIATRAWTTVAHNDGTSVRIGWLPGDVDANGWSGTADLVMLIDEFNGVVGQLPLRSTDIDRSGTGSPSDILRLIDLLNGAGVYDSFVGESLP